MPTLIDADDLFIAEFTETATIGSTDYDCVALSPLSLAEAISEIGSSIDIDVGLTFKPGDIAKVADGSLITFRSTVYRVARTTEDSANVTWTAYLISRYGGAA